MNGADALIETLKRCGVEVCFANPGTSEMHLVRALDERPGIRPVLTLFEGVASGMADGYARMAGKPAVTLFHLGPGLANALANLHNAKRAMSAVVNLVGDHPAYHHGFDAPLTSDIESLAGPMSVRAVRARTSSDLPRAGAFAVALSCTPPGGVVTLVVPSDCAWGEGAEPAAPMNVPSRIVPPPARAAHVAEALGKAKKPALLVSGPALTERGLAAAGRAAEATGALLFTDIFSPRLPRGAGRVAPRRLPYFPEQVLDALTGVDCLVLAGARRPVAFFAYPGQPGNLVPKGASVVTLAQVTEDAEAALEVLAETLGAKAAASASALTLPDLPRGPLTPESAGAVIARFLPDNAIVSDESATSGGPVYAACAAARPHDWLNLTGGSIGQGLPVAAGAAVACPGRKVVCLHGDGGAMYTVQTLWTMAREGLDVTVVIWSNRSYRILGVELFRSGATNPGPGAMGLLSLDNPPLDWPSLARGMGVEGVRATTAEEFAAQFESAMARRRPFVIEAVVG